MCGIAGIHRLTDREEPKLGRLMDELLLGIEHRGKDATGFAAITDKGTVVHQRASCEARKFVAGRKPIPANSRTVILHTRFATQGSPAFPENNHPVRSGDFYVVHNGHIWSDTDVFQVAPFKRAGQVDSEAIAAVLRMKGWTGALDDGLDMLDGNMAFAAINRSAPGELLLAKGWDSPLYVARSKHLLIWASTQETIRAAWAKVLGTPPKRFEFLSPGEALVVNGGEVREAEFRLGWGGYTKSSTVTPKVTPKPTIVSTTDAAGIVNTAIQRANARWREGSQGDVRTGGYIYTGQEGDPWDDVETLDDLTLARTYARIHSGEEGAGEDGIPSGIDLVRCDDCMDWTPVAETRVSHFGALVNILCSECHDHAVEAGIVEEDR